MLDDHVIGELEAAEGPKSAPPISTEPPTSSNAGEPPAPYPTSFAQIVELISTGQPVPGIKEIPATVLEGQGTAAVKARRKKPWEKDEGVQEGKGEVIV